MPALNLQDALNSGGLNINSAPIQPRGPAAATTATSATPTTNKANVATVQPTTYSFQNQSVQVDPKTGKVLNVSPLAQTPASPSAKSVDNAATPTTILSANPAIDHYVAANNFLNTTQQGVTGQAMAVSQARAAQAAALAAPTPPESGEVNTATDNTELTNALNNASGALKKVVSNAYNADGSTTSVLSDGTTTITPPPSTEDLHGVAGDDPKAIAQISAQDLAAFRQANPGLPFTADDLQHYQNANLTPAEQQTGQTFAGIQQQLDTATKTFNDSLASIQAGTFPLTGVQQSLLNNTQQSVNDLINAAKDQGQLYMQAGQTFGAVHGLAQFAPGLALQAINTAMVQAKTAVAKAEMDGTKQLADLQSGFNNDDYKLITDSYNNLTASLDKKNTLLTNLNNTVQKQVDAYNTQQDKIQTNAREALNTILTQLGGTAFTDLTPEQQAQIGQLEQQAGWPQGLMKEGLQTLKEKNDQATQQLNQEKVQAQAAQEEIANSFKETALAISQQNANIAANKADTAAALADLKLNPTGAVLGLSNDDVDNFIKTLNDYNGTKYVTQQDLEGLDATSKDTYIKAAKASGLRTLSPKDGDAMSSIGNAKADLQSLQDALNASTIPPKDWLGRPISQAQAKIGDWLQTNNNNALDTFQVTAVPLLSALKGTGTGGGGGAARLFENVANLLPKSTDTVSIAKQKINDLNALLDNGANSIIKNVSVSVPAGKVLLTSPTGQKGYVPEERLQDYLKQGYKQ